MEQLIELLKQIQELAGVAIDALEGAAGGDAEKPSSAGPEKSPASGGEMASTDDAPAPGGPPPSDEMPPK